MQNNLSVNAASDGPSVTLSSRAWSQTTEVFQIVLPWLALYQRIIVIYVDNVVVHVKIYPRFLDIKTRLRKLIKCGQLHWPG